MKQGIHPNWHNDTAVTCSCGNTFQIGSLTDVLTVDICNKCHPFFTGEMRFVDRQGRVEKFIKKMASAKVTAAAKKNKKAKTKVDTGPRKSYQDILRTQQTNLKQAATAQATPVAATTAATPAPAADDKAEDSTKAASK